MKRKTVFLPAAFIILSVVSSACIGLIPLDEKPTTGDYGPSYSPQEHQERVFDAIWMHLKDSYIYYESADTDWAALTKKYQERINSGLSNDEFIALIDELQTELPSGSLTYQSRAERIEAQTADASTYDGIGAFIGFGEDPAPHIILLSVIQGSPAEKAGLKAHDSISKIDGNPIQLEEGLNAVNRIRGPAGSKVTLNVQSPGGSERSIELQRAKLTSTGKLEASMLPGPDDYGYMLFPPVGYDTLMKDVVASLQTFTTNRTLEGLVLDLRIAGSARGWPLDELFKLFHDGNVGEFYNATQEQVLKINGEDQFSSQTVPLVILVGENTTGFPEILAAGMQSGGRADIVGSITPGAIETTTPFYLPNGALIFVESTSFRLLNGGEIGNSGVQPDVEVEAGWDEILPNADPVLEAAIKLLDAQK